MYMCVYTYLFGYVCIHAYMYVYVCIHIFIRICMYTCIYVCICVYTYIYMNMYVYMYICIYMCVYTNLFQYICVHTHSKFRSRNAIVLHCRPNKSYSDFQRSKHHCVALQRGQNISNNRSLLQNIVSFVGFFCKRDL